jgi:hypothetical protein
MMPVMNLSEDRQKGIKIRMIQPAKAMVLHNLKIFSGDITVILSCEVGIFSKINTNKIFQS